MYNRIMNKIELKNITKTYSQNTYGVKNINLEVKNGECLVLVGPSGSGKSTILRTIAGLIQPTKGEVVIDNRAVTDKKPGKRNLTFVFQDLALYPHMTVQENIEFSIKKHLTKDVLNQRIKHVAEDLDITKLLNKYPGELSGGEEQRTALARSLATDADIILMDEPLSSLDTALKREIIPVIERLKVKKSTTIIYITHDHLEAMKLADRILVLNDGQIEQVDKCEIVYNKPSTLFVAKFFGQSPMNIFTHNNHHYGIRPEDIIIKKEGSQSVKIIDIEVLGSEVYAKFLYKGEILTLMTNNQNLQINDVINVEFSKVHRF